MIRRMTQNPVDRLRGSRTPWRAIGVIALLAGVVAGGFFISGTLQPEVGGEQEAVRLVGGEGKPTVAQIEHKLLLTTHVAKTTTPPPPPPPPPAPENYYGNPGPIQCGYGYTAGAVDEYGNESNCYANGPDNAQCVAYDDANNCTQWYKP
jgi:hypothetical protein